MNVTIELTPKHLAILAAMANDAMNRPSGKPQVTKVAEHLGTSHAVITRALNKVADSLHEGYSEHLLVALKRAGNAHLVLVHACAASMLGWLEIGEYEEYSVSDRYAHLSPHRARVLRLLANGCTYEEVASQLYVTHNTVKTLVLNLRNDLGASSTPHAVALGFKRGIIEPEDILG